MSEQHYLKAIGRTGGMLVGRRVLHATPQILYKLCKFCTFQGWAYKPVPTLTEIGKIYSFLLKVIQYGFNVSYDILSTFPAYFCLQQCILFLTENAFIFLLYPKDNMF